MNINNCIPLKHACNTVDFTSTERFRSVEELLEAGSGASFYLQPWFIRGMPAFPNKSFSDNPLAAAS